MSRSPLTETDAGKVELLRVPVGASGKLGTAYMHAHAIWDGTDLRATAAHEVRWFYLGGVLAVSMCCVGLVASGTASVIVPVVPG